jgi:hypothetical protein
VIRQRQSYENNYYFQHVVICGLSSLATVIVVKFNPKFVEVFLACSSERSIDDRNFATKLNVTYYERHTFLKLVKALFIKLFHNHAKKQRKM